MRNNKLIVHIPHASLRVPRYFIKKVILDKKELKRFNLFMCDNYVDTFVIPSIKKIKFKYSRIFCDVERFKDDNKEIMAKKGMGICYKKDNKGKRFINYDKKYKEYIISSYYDKHHKKLDDICKRKVLKYGICYIIDLHSFSDDLVWDLFKIDNTPDICLGVDEDYTDINLLKYTEEYFKSKGYTIKINYPYIGTIVPNYFYGKKDSNIKSLMIEINKRLYMKNIRSYLKTRRLLKEYFRSLKKII